MSRATSGAGTKYVRFALGSDRMSADMYSIRSPGTCHENACGSARSRSRSWNSAVTPSPAVPGSNAYRSSARASSSRSLRAGSTQWVG